MEKPILTPTQKYGAAALFAVALHQSQLRQTQLSNHLTSLAEEPIGEGATFGKTESVSDDPSLWIHERSGLLFPVFRLLGVADEACDGLKETAGNSSQVRHHVAAFLTLLSEEKHDGLGGGGGEKKELALAKTVDAMAQGSEDSPAVSEEKARSEGYEVKWQDKLLTEEMQSSSIVGNATKEGGCDGGAVEKEVEEEKSVSYQRKVTVLYELLAACVKEKPEDGHISEPQRKSYDARHRVALRLLATWLNVEWTEVEAMEVMVACSLMGLLKEEDKSGDGEVSETSGNTWKRGGIICAAAVTGGTLMAITGGLAAPAIAQGLGALAPAFGSVIPAIGASGFAGAAGALGSAAGSMAVAASFGAAGAGLTGTKMARRIGDIEEFEFKEIGENHNQGRLAVAILISGFAFEYEDFVRPWEGHNDNLERYALQWESEKLTALSTAIQEWLTSKLATELMKRGAMFTVMNTLLAAISLPSTLLTMTDVIDSQWSVAIDRSNKAGKLLAEVLLSGLQGGRPVTLIGFSLGARVIFTCLQCLAEAGDKGSLVERVVLLGAPVSIKDQNWEDARRMVAGRFINAYSTNDWILGIAFRASLFAQGLAGIQPVDTPGIENVDVTELIEGHSSYLWKTKQILENLELDNYYPCFNNTHTKPEEGI